MTGARLLAVLPSAAFAVLAAVLSLIGALPAIEAWWVEAMFFHTDTADTPWTVIKSDCKKRARLNAMRYVLHKLLYSNKDLGRIGPVDPLLVGRAHVVYERGEKDAAIL